MSGEKEKVIASKSAEESAPSSEASAASVAKEKDGTPPEESPVSNPNTTPDPSATTEDDSAAAAAAAASAEKARIAELEARAVAEATASADASYRPTPSLLNAPTPHPLLSQVDGPSLKDYNGRESVYVARNVPVALRGRLDVPIHVTAGGSVVEYAVETVAFDICFGVTAEREEGVTIVRESQRVESHVNPVTGKFLVGSVPCALIFSFDNEYSWFREKMVTYKITVTPPTVENIRAGRRRRAKAALKAVLEDKTSAENRLSRATRQRTGLAAEIERMEKELAEKRKSLDVALKEESWLRKRVELRTNQEDMLKQRLEDGWEDEKDVDNPKGADTNGRAEV